MTNRLASSIVLFHPDPDVVSNISTLSFTCEKVYVVDNSKKKNQNIINQILHFPNAIFIDNNENLGIASALNIAAKCAIVDGYKYLLTMDQDSGITADTITALLEYIEKHDEVAIVSPQYKYKNGNPVIHSDTVTELSSVITSGNIIKLSAYKFIGGFNDKLFIDCVDIEYCYRLRSAGFKIVRLNFVSMYHEWANMTREKFLGVSFLTLNYSALRYYYITRNRLYLYRTYKNQFPRECREELINVWKNILKIIIVEKNKYQNMKYTCRGIVDFLLDRFPIVQ